MDVNILWASWSNLLIYSAMAVYAIAFIIYSLDLFGGTKAMDVNAEVVRGSQRTLGSQRTRARARVAGATDGEGSADGATTSGGVALAERTEEATGGAAGKAVGGGSGEERSRRWARVGTALTVLAAILHVGAIVLRVMAVHRVPWGNMMEYALVASALMVVTYLIVVAFRDLRFMGTFVTVFALVTLGLCITVFYTPAAQLIPALQTYWIFIHVPIAILSTALLSISAVVAIFQLLKLRYEKRVKAAAKDGGTVPRALRFLEKVPPSVKIETTSYRLAAVGFVTWTFTLIAGAVWAEVAWGRPWGWDTKEIWTFIVWVIYAAYLHSRATRGWSHTSIAVLNLVGFATVIFNFAIVNMYFNGLHSYSGLK